MAAPRLAALDAARREVRHEAGAALGVRAAVQALPRRGPAPPSERRGDGLTEADILFFRSNLSALRFKLALLKWRIKAGFNPNQPRVPAGNPDGGQWTSDGGGSVGALSQSPPSQTPLTRLASLDNQVMSDASPDPVTVWAQYAQYGSNSGDPDPAFERTKEILHNTLVRVNASVSNQQDGLSGALYGIRVHTEFAKAIREQDLPGIGIAGVEQSFDAQGLAHYGLDGSIRTDIVLRNEEGKIIAIFDVKTGNAAMGPTRANEIRAYTRVGPDVPIIILHAIKGWWRR